MAIRVRQFVKRDPPAPEKKSLAHKASAYLIYVPWLILVGLVVLLAVGICIRIWAPPEAIITEPFEVPADLQQHNITGKALARIFEDQLREVLDDGRRFADSSRVQINKKNSSATSHESHLEISDKASAPWIMKIEYQGLSFDPLAAWRKLVSREYLVTGDLSVENSQFILNARIQGPKLPGRFPAASSVGPYAMGGAGESKIVEHACHDLALTLVGDFEPARAGTYFLNRRDFSSAEKVLMNWLAREPDEYHPYWYLGMALTRDGHYSEAINYLNKSLAQSRNDYARGQVRNSLGAAYRNLGRYSEALSEFAASSTLMKGEVIPLINIAGVYSSAGQYEKAIVEYRKFVAKYPTDPFIQYNYGTTLLNSLAPGNLDAAIESLSTAIQLWPDDAEAHNNLAVALYKKKDIASAIKNAKKAVKLQPDNLNFQENLKTFEEAATDEAAANPPKH